MGAPRKLTLRQILAANVRRGRLDRGWVQEELAQESGFTQTYISQVESALRAVSVDAIERIAGALGVEPSTLLQKA